MSATLTKVGGNCILYAGRSIDLLNDIWVINTETWRWR